MPVLAPRRWVHGQHLEKLPAADQASLVAYLRDPCPTTVLVLTGERLDGRSKLAQAARTAGVLTVLEGPKPAELPRWILLRAQAAGWRMTQAAAARLGDLVGPELGVLAMSLEKLSLHAGDNEPIEVDDVVAVMASTRDASIFELTGAISRRDWATASIRLRALVGDGEAPLLLLNMVVRQARLLLGAKQAGGRAQDLAHALGVRPFVAEHLLRDARGFAEDELLRALSDAEACDLALKNSRIAPVLHLDHLLAQLCAAT